MDDDWEQQLRAQPWELERRLAELSGATRQAGAGLARPRAALRADAALRGRSPLGCAACGRESSPHARFCDQCGTALGRRCRACGEEVSEGARFCADCGARVEGGAAEAPAGEAEAGERRQLTVLFCDLVGSTRLSQQLDPRSGATCVRAYQHAAAARRSCASAATSRSTSATGSSSTSAGRRRARTTRPSAPCARASAIVDAMAPVQRERLAVGDGARSAVRIGMHTGPVVIARRRRDARARRDAERRGARAGRGRARHGASSRAATQRLVAGHVRRRGPWPAAAQGRARAGRRSTASCSRAGCAAASTSRRDGSRPSSVARSSWRRWSSAGSGRRTARGRTSLVARRGGRREVAARLPAARAPRGGARTRGSSAAPRPTPRARPSIR